MRHLSFAGLAVLIALCGCRTSDRTISLEASSIEVMPHQFQSGFLAIAYSSDGDLAVGISEEWGGFAVQEVSTGAFVGAFPGFENNWYPLLFSSDNRTVVMIAESSEGYKSAVVPVTGTDQIPEARSRASISETSEYGDDSSIGAVNYDSTLFALPAGIVVFQDGSLLVVDGALGTPFFDQFGAVWYRTSEGWTSVDRTRNVRERFARSKFLVQDQTVHRGSMHLLQDEVTIERNDAEAYVTAVWLDNDNAIMVQDEDSDELVQDRTALVYAGADVFSFSFVPNRKLIAVVTYEGTAFVPYFVETRSVVDDESSN